MSGKAPHKAEEKKREKFNKLHPEGRKAYAKKKRMERMERKINKLKLKK
mgnify:FL=1